MSRPLANQVAIVTGASRGIGRGIALKLASQGAVVGIVYQSAEDAAQKTVKDIESLGSSAKMFKADLKSTDAVRSVFAHIKEAFPQGIDIVVLNAGGAPRTNFSNVTEQFYDDTFNLNTKGTFFAAQEASKQLKDGGKLIFISTGSVRMAEPATIVYVAAKAAVEQFARLLAVALGPRKISVNVVAPGATQTDAFPEAMVPFAIGLTPLGRMGLPEDIAQVVLCVIQAPWITGAIIPANGGAIV